MRDNQQLMSAFVKIVERFPEIYDTNLDSYRTRFSEVAWLKCAAQVRKELKEECTVEELKIKWKGIRSSFSRYKAKLYQHNNDPRSCKKYYLYDYLRFLEPFTKTKGSTSPSQEQNKSTDVVVNESSIYVNVENMEETNDYANMDEWNHIEIKPEITSDRFEKQHEIDLVDPARSSHSEASYSERPVKRKCTHEDKDADDDSEDLQFFKSILPDIKTFTIKEKRKFKMGILKLIDDIENDRKSD